VVSWDRMRSASESLIGSRGARLAIRGLIHPCSPCLFGHSQFSWSERAESQGTYLLDRLVLSKIDYIGFDVFFHERSEAPSSDHCETRGTES
jgi:hypothetical protein